MKHGFALLLTALLACGCADMDAIKQPAPFATVTPAVPPPDPQTQMAELEIRLGRLVEDTRRQLDPKAKPLQLDVDLVKIARARATDMAAKKYLASTAPDGQTSASLLMAADEQYQGLLGENVAAQYYVTQSGVDPQIFAQRFLDTWLKSPAHRDNMIFTEYDRTGVGAAVNGDTVYVSLLFSTTTRNGGSGAVANFESPKVAQDAPAPKAPAPLRPAAR